MSGSHRFMLTVSVVLFAFMVLVRSALLEDRDQKEMYFDKRNDYVRALYELQADPRNNYLAYDRALRSNGKPTFIRFGKRSFLGREVPNSRRRK